MKTVAREFLEKFEGVLKLNEGYTEGNVEQMIPEREALELQQIQAKNMLSAKVIYRYEDGGLANKFKALEPDVKDYWGSPVMPGFCEIKTINLMGQQAVAFIHNTLTDDYFMVSPSKEALEMAVAGKTAPDAPKVNDKPVATPVKDPRKVNLSFVDKTIDQTKDNLIKGESLAKKVLRNMMEADEQYHVVGNKVYFEQRINRDLAIKWLTDAKKIMGLDNQLASPNNYIEVTSEESANTIEQMLKSGYDPDAQAAEPAPEPAPAPKEEPKPEPEAE